MSIIKKVFPVLGIIITALLIITFRSIPKGKSWNDYRVLYVKTSTMPANFEQLLMNCGISEYVSLKNQRIPIMLSRNSVEEAMLKINISSEQNKYLYDRQNYFYDSKGEYSLFYIPDLYDKKLDEAVKVLTKAGAQAGIDCTLSYMWLLPIVIVVMSVLLAVFSKNKLFFIITSILPCIYVFCNAFYACAISVIILNICLFVISNLYNRRGAVKKIVFGNMFLLIALAVSVVSAFSVSLKSGFFYILLLAGTACAVITALNCKSFSVKKYPFQPVLIRSARTVSSYGGKSGIVLTVMLVSAVVILAYFILGSFNIAGSRNKDNLMLPGKTNTVQTVSQKKLPVLEDFFRWNWNVITTPYISLNGNSEYDENHVVYERFVEEDGIIQPQLYTMYYNDSFKKSVSDGIEALDFYSIEKVLKAQGEDFLADYTKSVSYNVSIFSIIMMISCFCMLLFLYFSAIIGKGGKR